MEQELHIFLKKKSEAFKVLRLLKLLNRDAHIQTETFPGFTGNETILLWSSCIPTPHSAVVSIFLLIIKKSTENNNFFFGFLMIHALKG